MRQKKIKILKEYRKILIEIKIAQINKLLDEEVERKIPTYSSSNQKSLVFLPSPYFGSYIMSLDP